MTIVTLYDEAFSLARLDGGYVLVIPGEEGWKLVQLDGGGEQVRRLDDVKAERLVETITELLEGANSR